MTFRSDPFVMTMAEFREAWREECREFFAELAIIERSWVGPIKDDSGEHGNMHRPSVVAIEAQRLRRGPLLQDRLKDGSLIVEGWIEGSHYAHGRIPRHRLP